AGARFDLVVAAHAVNEVFAAEPERAEGEWIRDLARVLAPGGLLLLVEPGLRATSLRLRRAVALACESGALFPWAPELAGTPWRQGGAGGRGRVWPRGARPWTPPARARASPGVLGGPEPDLGFPVALLCGAPPPRLEPSPKTFRMTSPLGPAKGRFLWTGLGA